jgi:hypothetical protein
VATVVVATPCPAEVFIKEFLAVNVGAAIDEDGDTPDWIELTNTGTTAVDLSGWQPQR